MFLRLFVLLLLVLSVAGFDKNSVKKGKRDSTEKHHPISRRVLRFERSVAEEDFPQPEEFPVPVMDFAKPLPEEVIKTKPSQLFPDQEYQPEMEF